MTITKTSSKREPRIRYHLSKETAAELAHARRLTDHQSWDKFFMATLAQWKNNSFIIPKSDIAQHLKAIDQRLQNLDAREMEICKHLETQEQLLQSVEESHKQIYELMQNTNLLLVLARETSEDIQTKTTLEKPKAPSLRNSVINKIRSRRS